MLSRRNALALLATPLFPLAPSHEVLAFYYGWYATPEFSGHWAHWPEGTTHEPQLGRYDSHDPKVPERAFQQAGSAGITGLIVSWWRQGDFQDQGMPLLLAAAQRAGLRLSIYYEVPKPRQSPAVDATTDDLLYVLDRYSRGPAWLRAGDRPVIFVYARALHELGLPAWKRVIRQVKRRFSAGVCFIGDQISVEAAKIFDGIHSYNPTNETAHKSIDEIRNWAGVTYPQWVATAGRRISCVTVIPGYDDSKLNRPSPRPITSRYSGSTYRVLWEQAIAAHPNWILITSWNEWHEGSEIEPSTESGDRELNTTNQFAHAFVGK